MNGVVYAIMLFGRLRQVPAWFYRLHGWWYS